MENVGILKTWFDVEAWLDGEGVRYDVAGAKNVSDGWIGLNCPFCDDTSNHCGVKLADNRFFCWKCKHNGDVIELMRELGNLSFSQAVERLKEFQRVSIARPKEKRSRGQGSGVLPETMEWLKPHFLPRIVEKYFERRRFRYSLVEEFPLGFCQTGTYPLSVIVPIYMNGKVVSFQAADTTGKAKVSYRACPDDRALVPSDGLVYGLDDVKEAEKVFVVEGVTDRWRMGASDTIALLGKNFTKAKLLNIIRHLDRDQELVSVFDPDALHEGEQFIEELAWYFHKNKIIELDENRDPADMKKSECILLKSL